MSSVDLEIYLSNLRKWLTGSEKARELFISDELTIDTFMGEVRLLALQNIADGRECTLTTEQYEEIRLRYNSPEPLFKIDGFPPIFLN